MLMESLFSCFGSPMAYFLSLGNFSCLFFLSPADFLQNFPFQEFLSGALSECQTVWIQRFAVSPDLGPNCFQRLSADNENCRYQGKLNHTCAAIQEGQIFSVKSELSFSSIHRVCKQAVVW